MRRRRRTVEVVVESERVVSLSAAGVVWAWCPGCRSRSPFVSAASVAADAGALHRIESDGRVLVCLRSLARLL